jgi:hypothetical protein
MLNEIILISSESGPKRQIPPQLADADPSFALLPVHEIFTSKGYGMSVCEIAYLDVKSKEQINYKLCEAIQ